jgi:hypothetical protein
MLYKYIIFHERVHRLSCTANTRATKSNGPKVAGSSVASPPVSQIRGLHVEPVSTWLRWTTFFHDFFKTTYNLFAK